MSAVFGTPQAMRALVATLASPVTVYYCKAGIQAGRTIRVMQNRVVWETSRISIAGAMAEMWHDNAKGKPKASGARCVLEMTLGTIAFPDFSGGAS